MNIRYPIYEGVYRILTIYFYTDDSNPYKNMKLDMDALKQYNRFIYPLSLFLNRIL